MWNYLIRRSFYGVLVLLGVNLFTFMLFFTVNTPDDMARLNIGSSRAFRVVTGSSSSPPPKPTGTA